MRGRRRRDGCAWMRVERAAGVDRRRGARITCAAPARDRVLDRVAAYEGVADGRGRSSTPRSTGVQRARAARVRRSARRAPARLGVALGGRRRRDRGRPRAAAGGPVRALPLMASVPDEGEAAVGARGLSGTAYRGHVFWDSDVYVLPFLAATHPQAARAMLEYRIRRLPAALRAARAPGTRRRPLPVGVRAHPARTSPRSIGARPPRRARADPHRRARGAHRRRRRLGRRLLHRLDRRSRRSRPAPGASCSCRPRAGGRRGSSWTPTAAATSAA